MFMFGFADKSAPGPQQQGPNPELDDEFLDEEESVGDEISETLMALMPWGISILFHVALVVAAFFFVWQVILVEEEQEPVIPDAAFSETPGAPDPIETVQEESSDSPRTTPTVDPERLLQERDCRLIHRERTGDGREKEQEEPDRADGRSECTHLSEDHG